MHDVETIFHISYLLTAYGNLFGNMNDARETAIAINTLGMPYIASTACTRSHIATTKQKQIISKI